jgi:hypothetical protein
MRFNGQAAQDYFVRHMVREKRGGTFVEIGSNHPVRINNTIRLEADLGWRGIMVEYDPDFLPLYQDYRPTAHHIIADATAVDFAKEFKAAAMPADIDYLQVDLEVSNGSTLKALMNLDEQVMDNHRFAVVTFEHDVYCNVDNVTRSKSREIFAKRGYMRVFSDISNDGLPYEDWYVHPDLVDMDIVRAIQQPTSEGLDWINVVKRIDTYLGIE